MALIIHPSIVIPRCFLSPPLPQNPFSLCLPKPTNQPPTLKPHQRQLRHSTTTQPLISPQPSTPKPISSIPVEFSADSASHGNVYDFANLLRLSVRYGDAVLAKAVHAFVLKLEGSDIHLGDSLVLVYLKLGLVSYAYKAFDVLLCPSVVSYTALISNFAKTNREDEALGLYFRMRSRSIEPNEYTFVAILTVCIRTMDLQMGSQVHGMLIKTGYLDNVYVSNALMGLYGKCRCEDYVLTLFDEMRQRDIASWNTVISSMVKKQKYDGALNLFRDMRRTDGYRVDHFTLSTLLTACARSFSSIDGKQVHAYSLKLGLEEDLSIGNALLGFYTKFGDVKDVEALFEEMPVRDVITWTEMIVAYMENGLVSMAVEIFKNMPERNSVSYNALMAGFCKNGLAIEALVMFVKMVEKGLQLTECTLSTVLNACGLLMDRKSSEQLHGFVIKFGCKSNECIESTLLDMCTRCGRMADAEKIFRLWPFDKASPLTWTSMIGGYARNGQGDKAISLFHHYISDETSAVDEVASTSVLGVCGDLGFQEMGEQIHCHTLKSGCLSDVGLGNALISMYSKCWDINSATVVFNSMPIHDLVSWNSLISGHLLYGQGDEALTVWSKMKMARMKPDDITFVLIISAYRYTRPNLVDDCRRLFSSMKTLYGIEPNSEHYARLISVLGHWGLLKEAEETISEMPFPPVASVWRALLDSCRIHSNATIGKRVAKRILDIEPQDPSTYILVSNLYSASGRWQCSEMVREKMREKGLRKYPARSWVIHQSKLHSFHARDKSHPQTKDIYSGLEILIKECLKAGYVPDTSFVLHEVEEYQKREFLFYHSAKLAAAYGLLMTRTGKPIRIVKNILLCGDCHAFMKYLSVITDREIIVRDTSGFHRFSNGQCSCNDYWSS